MNLPSKKITFSIIIGVVILWLFLPIALFISIKVLCWHFAISIPDTEYAKFGQLGDAFNIFTSLVSALALLGVIAGLYMQRLQMKEDAESQKKQSEHLGIQNDAILAQLQLMRESARLELKEKIEAAKPNFIFKTCQPIFEGREIVFHNSGATVTDLSCDSDPPCKFRFDSRIAVSNQTISLRLAWLTGREFPDMVFRIHYVDRLGASGKAAFKILKKDYNVTPVESAPSTLP